MSGRVVHRTFCSKTKNAHLLATITASDVGLVVTYKAMSRDGEGKPTADSVSHDERPAHAHDGVALYCQACAMEYFLDLGAAFDVARVGGPDLFLQSKGMMTDPLGVLRRRYGELPPGHSPNP